MKVKNDHRSIFSNLSNWKEEAWNNQGFNGIRTRDLRDAGAMLYQLSYEATHLERGQFMEFIFPVRSEMMWSIYEIIHIWTASGLLRIQALFTVRHALCFAVLLVALGFANANHKRWISICCKTSEASVVILAAKLKVVAESRTRVYFVKHVASTCNIVFCCETSWSQTSSTRNNAF